MIDQIIKDIRETHVILNAQSGHGKSSALMTIIQELKRQEPKTIVKVFDVSQAWFWKAPLPYRQKITPPMLFDYLQGKPSFLNINDCVYEMGSLTEEMRRFFVAIIIREDYDSRRNSGYANGPIAISDLPRIVFVFEESDTYFDSASLNKKDDASAILRDFIKVGRNFGLRAFCVTTAAVGELGTKLRRRSKHLIGKIISDSDYREYNRMRKGLGKGRKKKGLGDLALELPRFHWIYFNGEVSEMFTIGDKVRNVPKDYVREQRTDIKKSEQPEVKESKGMSTLTKIVLTIIATFILTIILLRL